MSTRCTDTLAWSLQMVKPTVSSTSMAKTPFARAAPAKAAFKSEPCRLLMAGRRGEIDLPSCSRWSELRDGVVDCPWPVRYFESSLLLFVEPTREFLRRLSCRGSGMARNRSSIATVGGEKRGSSKLVGIDEEASEMRDRRKHTQRHSQKSRKQTRPRINLERREIIKKGTGNKVAPRGGRERERQTGVVLVQGLGQRTRTRVVTSWHRP